ncbi:MAG: DEAD/DEAH box helicase family protein [Candidatus Aenigmarchaeota archaeon]|nr:DEAD/DEAH box helicase family protein [Candidatus Aenigmarchaeota archaeon]
MFIEHPLIKKGALQIRDYQVEIAKSAISKNTLVVIPTGMGKTNIALLVVAERLNKVDGKVLFLAPTKPLVEQHKKTFEKLSELADLEVITGTIRPDLRGKHYQRSRIIFATPQTIENDLKSGILNFEDFVLLIVDEAHRSVGNYAYTYIAENYMGRAKNPLLIALTASPGGRVARVEEIKKNLFIESVEFRSEKDSDVSQYVKDREMNTVQVELPAEYLEAKKLLQEIISSKSDTLCSMGAVPTKKFSKKMLLEFQNFYAKKASQTKNPRLFQAMSKIAELIKLDYCLELLETQGAAPLREYLKKLKTESTKASASMLNNPKFMGFLKRAENLPDHPKMNELEKIVKSEIEKKVIVFTQYRATASDILFNLKRIEGVKPALLIGQKSGLTQKEQVSVIRDFEDGFFNVLICTSIGEEGLDIKGVGTAVFYEPVPSEIRSIQRRGRVARLVEGKLYVLVAKDTRDEAYYWTAYHKEKKMSRSLGGEKEQAKLGDFESQG